MADSDSRGDSQLPTVSAEAPSEAGSMEVFATGFARFRILRELGRGGMGVVLAAYDPALEREVAVKVLHGAPRTASECRRFVREARITGQLAHPAIPPIYEIGTAPGGVPYFAMKIMGGTSLSERLDALRARPRAAHRRHSPFPPSERLDVLTKVGEALELAHAHGVIHRDLKPGNVMVGEFGEVQLMDWGVAKRLGGEASSESGRRPRADETQDGDVAGTPAYMAPEQARGDLTALDARTDVFALGALLYEMLCLGTPYPEGDVEETLDRASAGAWQPIWERLAERPGLAPPPRELAAIAHKAMAPEPADRYASVADMLADIRAFRALESVTACPDTVSGRLAKLLQRHPRGALALAGALVVAVMLALLWRRVEAEQLRTHVAEAESRAHALEAERERTKAEHAEQARADAARRADELGGLAVAKLSSEARAAIDQFLVLWSASQARGEDLRQFLDSLGVSQIERFLVAFDSLHRVRELAGSAPTASDHAHRGLLRHAKNDCAGAIEDYDRALAIDPSDATTWSNLGLAHQSCGRHAQALAAFDHALAINANHVLALTNRAVARRDAGDLPGARADAERALELAPDSSGSWVTRAGLRQADGDLEGAITDYDRALELAPRSALVLSNRGSVRYAKGDVAGALEDLDRALALAPADVTALSNRGQVRSRQGDVAGAAADLDRALALDATSVVARFNRGTLRLKAHDVRGAITDFDQLLGAAPNHAGALENRGLARLEGGDFTGALADLGRLVELEPRQPRGWANLGNARARSGDLEGGLADFDRAIALDERWLGPRLNRVEVLLLLRRPADALTELDRALELAPRDARVWSLRARTKAKLGDAAGALADVDRALEIDPALLDARSRRAVLRQQAGNDDGAIADYLALLAVAPTSWSEAANLGQLLARRGQRAEAMRWLRLARQHCPDPNGQRQLDALIAELGG